MSNKPERQDAAERLADALYSHSFGCPAPQPAGGLFDKHDKYPEARQPCNCGREERVEQTAAKIRALVEQAKRAEAEDHRKTAACMNAMEELLDKSRARIAELEFAHKSCTAETCEAAGALKGVRLVLELAPYATPENIVFHAHCEYMHVLQLHDDKMALLEERDRERARAEAMRAALRKVCEWSTDRGWDIASAAVAADKATPQARQSGVRDETTGIESQRKGE